MWTSGVGKGKVLTPARPFLFALAAVHMPAAYGKHQIKLGRRVNIRELATEVSPSANR
jgi:hypothetical protein